MPAFTVKEHVLSPNTPDDPCMRVTISLALPLIRSRDKMLPFSKFARFGEVREWTNRRAWRARELATVPWVRIPPSPPYKACSTRSLFDGSWRRDKNHSNVIVSSSLGQEPSNGSGKRIENQMLLSSLAPKPDN